MMKPVKRHETVRQQRHKAWCRAVALSAGALILWGFSPANAEPLKRPGHFPTLAQYNVPKLPECTCRAKGQVYRIGDQVCLSGANGNRLFRCDMDLNVTSWKPEDQPCPLS
jgi:hypothetical protein